MCGMSILILFRNVLDDRVIRRSMVCPATCVSDYMLIFVMILSVGLGELAWWPAIGIYYVGALS